MTEVFGLVGVVGVVVGSILGCMSVASSVYRQAGMLVDMLVY